MVDAKLDDIDNPFMKPKPTVNKLEANNQTPIQSSSLLSCT